MIEVVELEDLPGLTPAPLPGYRELYARWERQHWSATAIDFSIDAGEWQAADESRRRHVLTLGRFAGFLHLESSVADNLAPYLRAMPREEQRLFLSTQLVDEAKHVVLFDRFHREVLNFDCEGDDLASLVRATEPWMSPAFHRFTWEIVPDAAERLRLDPDNITTLIEAVTTYHVVAEACLAMSTQRLVLRDLRRLGMFPGLIAGFAGALRDEVRHVQFGIRFLRDMIADDPDRAKIVVRKLEYYLPLLTDILCIPREHRSRCIAMGFDPDERIDLGRECLLQTVRGIGLPVDPSFAQGLSNS